MILPPKEQGFTILEILFVVTVIAITVTIVTISFSKLNSSQALDRSATLVASVLDEARSLALSSKDASQYGVYLGDSETVLFKGVTYSPSDPLNVVNTLHSLVGIRDVTLSGGGTSVVFKRLTGNTDQTGSLEIFLKASTTTFRIITISATGIVELN